MDKNKSEELLEQISNLQSFKAEKEEIAIEMEKLYGPTIAVDIEGFRNIISKVKQNSKRNKVNK